MAPVVRLSVAGTRNREPHGEPVHSSQQRALTWSWALPCARLVEISTPGPQAQLEALLD